MAIQVERCAGARPARAACITALVAVILATVTGCDSTSPLQQLLPSTPTAGLPNTVITDQQLDASGASHSTPLDSTSVDGFLTSSTFQQGYTRVWGTAPTYVTALVLRFGVGADATRFLGFARSAISSGINTFVTDHAAIPGSFVFVLGGNSVAGGSAAQFCNGVWFTRGTDAFESIVCGADPTWATQAEDLAASEYALARQELPSGQP